MSDCRFGVSPVNYPDPVGLQGIHFVKECSELKQGAQWQWLACWTTVQAIRVRSQLGLSPDIKIWYSGLGFYYGYCVSAVPA